MRNIRESIRLLFLAVLIVLALPATSAAHLERFFVSSRTFSLGGAFVSLADDPSATVSNPAGLVQMPGLGFLTSLARPYGVTDLEESFIAAAAPVKIGTIGISWHRFALRDVTSEDRFTLAFGRDFIRTSQDASLSFGGSLDLTRVSYSGAYDQSEMVVTGALSVLLRPFPIIGLGYTAGNIGQPSFDFVPGGGSTTLEATHAFGFAYYGQQRRYVLLYERRRGQDGRWSDHAGMEVFAGSILRLRGGLDSGDVTGGIGVYLSGVNVDIGFASHDVLGMSYLVSVGFTWSTESNEFQEKH